jgi:tRNA threonylcarbamoyladenosine biosynthesis protein TsaE
VPPIATSTPDETAALGERLGQLLFEGAVVCLLGDLGAGKTCFTQGIARGLGVEGPVQSPTFILIAEYPEARVPLRHADLYRLRSEAEAASLGIEERAGVDGAWIVEWADRFPDLWPEDRLEVELRHTPEGRTVEARATGPRHAPLLAAFADHAPAGGDRAR